jgi:hypothetical protein
VAGLKLRIKDSELREATEPTIRGDRGYLYIQPQGRNVLFKAVENRYDKNAPVLWQRTLEIKPDMDSVQGLRDLVKLLNEYEVKPGVPYLTTIVVSRGLTELSQFSSLADSGKKLLAALRKFTKWKVHDSEGVVIDDEIDRPPFFVDRVRVEVEYTGPQRSDTILAAMQQEPTVRQQSVRAPETTGQNWSLFSTPGGDVNFTLANPWMEYIKRSPLRRLLAVGGQFISATPKDADSLMASLRSVYDKLPAASKREIGEPAPKPAPRVRKVGAGDDKPSARDRLADLFKK